MKGKAVVITGGTSGIGEVAAEALAQISARIILVARSKSRAEAPWRGSVEADPAGFPPGAEIGGAIFMSARPKILKGVEEPVRAWAALRPSSVESRFEAMHAGVLTELVGREEELELLLRRWSKAKTSEGQVVLLSGEPGIGKSRLTAALLERLAAEPHTRLRYFCSPQHTDSALYPIISQMERAAGFTHADTAQVKLQKARCGARAGIDPQTGRRAFSRNAVAAERRTLPNARYGGAATTSHKGLKREA